MAYFITMETYFITMETSASWMIRGIHVFQTSWHASHGGPAKGETVTLRWGVELCSSTQAALNFDLVRSITNWTFHSFTVCCLSQWVYILYHDSSTERLLTENSRGSGACTVLYTLGPVNQTGLYACRAEWGKPPHYSFLSNDISCVSKGTNVYDYLHVKFRAVWVKFKTFYTEKGFSHPEMASTALRAARLERVVSVMMCIRWCDRESS